MNRSDYLFAFSEREQLLKLLKETPEDQIISRMSLESRLKKIEKVLANAHPRENEPTKAVITFRGPTVLGSHGISASFGSRAISIFNDAISYVASAFVGTLPTTGPVPNADSRSLMITASARGSFGFVLEEFTPDTPLAFDEKSLVSRAIDKTQDILQASLDNDDDALSEAIDDLDIRALDKIRSFIIHLNDNKTVFTLKHDHHSLIYSNVNQLERAVSKLSLKNIKEEAFSAEVVFLGTLPNKRQCEFIILGETDIKTAKIDKSVESPDLINKHLGYKCNAIFKKITVGSGKPRFVLVNLPSWYD
ncbi:MULTISPECIES: hypothetical protein [Pectobacterium]|uniref:hypothetical protein n=1 Tax=Pectobacterium TaxID=122277 RepID=UPI0023AA6C05|nr:hypothetical protein [Pectobacterium actinidiae]WEF10331.1 hypothetical protein M9782_14035 [Pectobacterium actinidiae]